MTNYIPVIIYIPEEYRDMLRRVQNTPENLHHRATILGIASSVPRGNTNASEDNWRKIQYDAAKSLLAMAGSVINETVEGGVPSDNCGPMMFLALATALASGGAVDIKIEMD